MTVLLIILLILGCIIFLREILVLIILTSMLFIMSIGTPIIFLLVISNKIRGFLFRSRNTNYITITDPSTPPSKKVNRG